MKLLNKLAKTLQGNFAIFTIVIALLGYFVPQLFNWAGSFTSFFMAIVMFGMSLTMEIDDFKTLLKRPKPMIIGILLIYLVSSSVMFVTVKLLSLPVGLSIGLLLAACTPGGVITNVMTFIADGDVPLSVGLTSVGTILAPILTPGMAFLMVGQWTEVDAKGMIISMLLTVVLPLALGLAIKFLFHETASKVQEFSPLLSLVSLAIIIGAIVAKNGSNLLKADIKLFIACLIFVVVPTFIALWITKLFGIPEQQGRAIGIETGLKNSILASILATQNFTDEPTAALPGIVIALMASVLGPILANYWAKTGKSKQAASTE